MNNKRGNMTLAKFAPIVMVLILAFITLAVGSSVHKELANQQCDVINSSQPKECNTESLAYNATYDTLQTYQNMSNLAPVLGVVLMAALILGLLAFFKGR